MKSTLWAYAAAAALACPMPSSAGGPEEEAYKLGRNFDLSAPQMPAAGNPALEVLAQASGHKAESVHGLQNVRAAAVLAERMRAEKPEEGDSSVPAVKGVAAQAPDGAAGVRRAIEDKIEAGYHMGALANVEVLELKAGTTPNVFEFTAVQHLIGVRGQRVVWEEYYNLHGAYDALKGKARYDAKLVWSNRPAMPPGRDA